MYQNAVAKYVCVFNKERELRNMVSGEKNELQFWKSGTLTYISESLE